MDIASKTEIILELPENKHNLLTKELIFNFHVTKIQSISTLNSSPA